MKILNKHIFFKLVILFKEIYPKKEIQEISKITSMTLALLENLAMCVAHYSNKSHSVTL